jgi:hypothetical protein
VNEPTQATPPAVPASLDPAVRAARVRRSAIILGLIAFAFYMAFIVMSVTGVRR